MSKDPARNGPGLAPGYANKPDHVVRSEMSPKRIRAMFSGLELFDTTRALILFETNHVPVYYIPREDVAESLLTRTETVTYCPFKGEASYWTITGGGRQAEDAVWSYETPFDEAAGLAGYMAFYWNRIDSWYEEDEEVFVHARSPYVRIDILPSSRPVRIVLAGVEIAQSSRALFLFETGLPVRYYLPRDDVQMDLLVPSESATRCPYKGTAAYYNADIGGDVHGDIAWYYPDPVEESARIVGHVCFYNEKVDAIFVDGVEQPLPVTKWSR
jgi:uncharacterized protein (DUF427 family)